MAEVNRLRPAIAELEKRLRLPLVELALPTLRQLSDGQFELFRRVLTALAAADRQTDLFEFALEKVVVHQLEPHFRPRSVPVQRFGSLDPLREDCRLLVAACADAVTADGVIEPEEAELFRAVCAAIDVPCPPLL